jgi:hypothetical protein
VTLADLLRLAWEAGASRREPGAAIEALVEHAVEKGVEVPSRLEAAREKHRRLRAQHPRLSARRLAALCGVAHRTIRAWQKMDT